jgi:hypothetical protein
LRQQRLTGVAHVREDPLGGGLEVCGMRGRVHEASLHSQGRIVIGKQSRYTRTLSTHKQALDALFWVFVRARTQPLRGKPMPSSSPSMASFTAVGR